MPAKLTLTRLISAKLTRRSSCRPKTHPGEAHADEAHVGEGHAGEAHVGEGHAGEAHADEAHAGEARADETCADVPARDEPERPETGRPEAPENTPGALQETGSRPASDPPRIWADGSWEWKGQRLTSGQGKIAEEMLSRCRAAEGRTVFGTYADTGLTPAMRRVEAELEHGHLVPDTEKFALKSADRFKEKLAKLIADEPGAEPAGLAADIPDAIRYTYLFTEYGYTEDVWQVHNGLEAQGFELEVRRNSWDNEEYKGINSRWRDPASGQLFEVQFHTSLSWEAKQRTHEAYEGISATVTPASQKERLREYQRQVSASVPIPPGSLDVPNYRKED